MIVPLLRLTVSQRIVKNYCPVVADMIWYFILDIRRSIGKAFSEKHTEYEISFLCGHVPMHPSCPTVDLKKPEERIA